MAEWDFSGDELLFMIVAGVASVYGLYKWVPAMVMCNPLRRPESGVFLIVATVIGSLAALYAVLNSWADPQYVVGHADYILLFMLGGGVWVVESMSLMAAVGIDARDDVIERSNPAAMVAVCGGLGGYMLVYIYSNVGGGPTIWTTLLPAAAGSICLLLLWALIEISTHVSDSVTIDRDIASGLRLAGFALAAGAILGRALAGDWESWELTFAEFAKLGWPAVVIAGGMVVLQRIYVPTPSRPHPHVLTQGFIPAVVMIGIAVIELLILGAPEVRPAKPNRPGAVMVIVEAGGNHS